MVWSFIIMDHIAKYEILYWSILFDDVLNIKLNCAWTQSNICHSFQRTQQVSTISFLRRNSESLLFVSDYMHTQCSLYLIMQCIIISESSSFQFLMLLVIEKETNLIWHGIGNNYGGHSLKQVHASYDWFENSRDTLRSTVIGWIASPAPYLAISSQTLLAACSLGLVFFGNLANRLNETKEPLLEQLFNCE